MGDARVYSLDAAAFTGYHPLGYENNTKRNGNVGVDGTAFQNGFEVWIARWNFGDNISWAYRTFKLDGQYQMLTGKSGIIKSYNTDKYDVTVYFYSGNDLLYSFRMIPSSNQFNFSVDVSGVDELKVLVKDNITTSGGTSYAIYDLFLDKESSQTITAKTKIAVPSGKYCIQAIDENGMPISGAKVTWNSASATTCADGTEFFDE